jgi:lipoprotein-releasing system permease protein
MWQPVSLFISLRYLRARRGNQFLSFISMTSMLGLTVGIAVLIIVISVMNGFDRELKTRILGTLPHAIIQTPALVSDWHALAARIAQEKNVVGVAPYMQMQAILAYRDGMTGVKVAGVEPESEQAVSIVGQHFIQGDLQTLQQAPFNIVIGAGIAHYLGVAVGDKITLLLPDALMTPAGLIPRYKRFTVTGIFQLGAELDSTFAMIHLPDAAKLLRLGDTTQSVRVQFDDLFVAHQRAAEIAAALGPGFSATDWTATHGSLFRAVKLEKMMMSLLLLLIVAVAAFNILSSLVMLVTNKTRDIAILKTMGAESPLILRVFIIQGVLIGFIGIVAGATLGLLAAFNITDFMEWMNHSLGLNLFGAYFVTYLPSEVREWDIVFILCAAAVLTLCATIYPALRASAIEPSEALRYD